MRPCTHNVQQGEEGGEVGLGGGEREGKKTVWHRDMRSVERSRMGLGTRGKQDGHARDFQEGKQEI